ncbi:MAG: MBL fold metallo-hydrolase [Bacteroidetes bacterium]|nr:MBL fold metallo-hydrolase [Bacteroidota bacterium]
MRIKVLGAGGGEVTGSAYLVETDHARVLVDCGIFQGGKKVEGLNRFDLKDVSNLDAVLITHAHLDHTGRLPLLSKMRVPAPVFCTQATLELTSLILRDSAHVQEMDTNRLNRKRQRAGMKAIQPLVSHEDTEDIIGRLIALPYDRDLPVATGIKASFAEAGHMLGSSCIQLSIEDKGSVKKVIFSGDLGPKGAPILKDFEELHTADAVFMETTYGDRDHKPLNETVNEFIGIVQTAVADKGKILIPTFAVGRAQLMISILASMFRVGHVPLFPIFLDSPMAIEASKIYFNHKELYDEELLEFIRQKPMMEDLKTLKMCPTSEDSIAINNIPGPMMVLAGAGMCNAGRILHHLKYNLWKPETHVIIVGYQGSGTLGRMLVEGAEKVRIFGDEISVKAKIHTLGGFSAHAGQKDLLDWFSHLAPVRPKLVLIHGENGPRTALGAKIKELYGTEAAYPALNQDIFL